MWPLSFALSTHVCISSYLVQCTVCCILCAFSQENLSDCFVVDTQNKKKNATKMGTFVSVFLSGSVRWKFYWQTRVAPDLCWPLCAGKRSVLPSRFWISATKSTDCWPCHALRSLVLYQGDGRRFKVGTVVYVCFPAQLMKAAALR